MAITNYHDFLLVLDDVSPDSSGSPQSFSVHVFDSPVGQGERKETVSLPAQLPPLLDALLARQLDTDLPRQFELGERLAGLLLPPYARGLFTASLARLNEGEGLRLRLRLADALSGLPWEFAYLQGLRGERTASSFLALDTRLSIVRDLALPFPADDEENPPLHRRLLAAMAAPGGLPPLPGLPAEQAALRRALDPIAGLEVEYLPDNLTAPAAPRVTAQALADALQLHPHTDIFHFSGHGVFRPTPAGPSEGLLALEDAEGKLNAISADRLCELLRSNGVRLAFLNACQSAQRDTLALWNSLAAAMLRARIPAVLAMQTKIRDDLAAAFSAAFYRALVAGFPLDYAAAVGRLAVRNAAGGSNVIDWGVPVLYARSTSRLLFQPVEDASARKQAERELPVLTQVQVNQQVGQAFGPVIGEFHGDIANLSVFESPAVEPPPSAERSPKAEVEPAAGGSDCPNCGAANSAGAKFCEQCGAKMGELERKCKNCGEVLRSSARFCPKCGAPNA